MNEITVLSLLPYLKKMRAEDAIYYLEKHGLYEILPEEIQKGLKTERSQIWLDRAEAYLRDVYRTMERKEEERKRAKQRLGDLDIPII
jgi:hypothetical protein